jgi:ribosomal-protein-alanine N-acetyltransferase
MQEIEFYRNLPRLETTRLILRKYTLDDLNDYFEFASDPEVTRYLRWGPHPDKKYSLEYLQEVLNDYSKGKDRPWGLEIKTKKKIIGGIHIMQLDSYHKKAEIGFVLSKAYWNKGYMTEALNKVLDYCFTELSLNRIEAFCIPGNYAAIKVLERIGMQMEGILRQYAFQKGNFQDFRLFSILKADYETSRRL